MTANESAVWRVQVGPDAETSALFEPALAPPAGALFVCGHGAGGHMADPAIAALTRAVRERGIDTVRFNFLYRERRSNRPDPMPLLRACLAAVAEQARRASQPRRLLLGGRSMGGRVASMLAADGSACDGLLLLAYPLHPAGRPNRRRDAHFARIAVPVLCVNGTRDALCRRELMEQAIGGLRAWTMHWLEGADHGFRVLKSSGRTEADVRDEIGEACSAWLRGLA